MAFDSGLEVTGCGSYRRGKQTCGDLDVLVTHEDEDALDELFERILAKLRETGFLTDDLTVQRDENQQVTYPTTIILLDKTSSYWIILPFRSTSEYASCPRKTPSTADWT